MADGGEGTLSVLLGKGGRPRNATVSGPMGKKTAASYGILAGGRTAVVEMAQASGLGLIAPKKRDPLRASSFGTGELIARALSGGAEKVILTLGGVATSDAGTGMAGALGWRFLDRNGWPIPPGAAGLLRLEKILPPEDPRALSRARFLAACDVNNPLLGPRGSARVYGPQKGATREMVRAIERAFARFSGIVRRDLGKNIAALPGAGAAGGAGAGAAAFLNAELRPGIELVIEMTGLRAKMAGADIVLTGEGRIDGQTRFGKTASGVAGAAKRLGIPVVAFCGEVGPGARTARSAGILAFAPIARGPMSAADSLRLAPRLLREAAEETFRMLRPFLPG